MARLPQPTIKDVARVAGVSMKTVSRVVNRERGVREDTALRVRSVADDLGYSVNPAARRLSSGRTGSIGIIVYAASQWQWTADLVAGALARCRVRGHGLVPYVLEHYERDERETVLWLAAHHAVDGVILTTPWAESPRLHEELAARGMPIVLLPAPARTGRLSVRFDEMGAGRLVAEHLLALGHRRIAIVGGQAGLDMTRGRLRGVEVALAAAGLDPKTTPRVFGDYTHRTGLRAADQLLAGADRPTAVICFSDMIAAGVLRGAHERGLAVPRDLSVTGMGDQVIAEMVWPTLTTVSVPTFEMAGRAVDLLLDSITGLEVAENPVFPAQLVLRDSTAA